jgi:hypothetical protein
LASQGVCVEVHRQVDIAVSHQLLRRLRMDAGSGKHRSELTPQTVEIENAPFCVLVGNPTESEICPEHFGRPLRHEPIKDPGGRGLVPDVGAQDRGNIRPQRQDVALAVLLPLRPKLKRQRVEVERPNGQRANFVGSQAGSRCQRVNQASLMPGQAVPRLGCGRRCDQPFQFLDFQGSANPPAVLFRIELLEGAQR